jgi:vancomycin permeability regulator SanA
VAGRIAIGRRRLIRTAWKLGVCGVIAILSVLGLAGAVIAERAEGLVVTDLGAVPARSTVIVPGARVEPDGQPGLNVGDRLAAAAALIDRGTVDHVLVSGDNRESHYNEPVAMRNWLVDSAGIDPADVTVDYAGLDTWDTCRRANEQFGVAEAVVVTQDLYANRTAALCTAAGIETVVLAVDSPHQPLPTRSRLRLRERLAAVKGWRDIVRRPLPHHGGPYIGLVGSIGMPEGGHPPDWDWQATPSPGAGTTSSTSPDGAGN